MFSIIIPTWNNLPYLRLVIESLRRHSMHSHQIIVHVNDGSDGTLAWVRDVDQLRPLWSSGVPSNGLLNVSRAGRSGSQPSRSSNG